MSDLQDTFHKKFVRPILELLFKQVSYEERMNCVIERLYDKDIEEIKKLYISMLCEVVDDEEAIRKLAEPYLTDFEINGDSYGVPSIVDVVESLAKRIPNWRKLEK